MANAVGVMNGRRSAWYPTETRIQLDDAVKAAAQRYTNGLDFGDALNILRAAMPDTWGEWYDAYIPADLDLNNTTQVHQCIEMIQDTATPISDEGSEIRAHLRY